MSMKTYEVVITLEVTAESEDEALDYALEDAKELHESDTIYANITQID